MKILFLILFIITTNVFGQVNQIELREKVKNDANKMGNFFVTRDHEKFVEFMYPKAVAKSGGKEIIVKNIIDGLAEMDNEGVIFKSIEFDEPSSILEKNNTLQCIIPQIITMKVKGGTLKSRASLFAISEDGGENWFFIDVSTTSIDQIKFIVPDFHTGLEIPKWPEPVYTPDE